MVHQEIEDHLVNRDRPDRQVRLAIQVDQACRVQQDLQVLTDFRVTLVDQASPVQRDLRVPAAGQAQPALPVRMASLDQLELEAKLVIVDHPDQLVHLVTLDHQVFKDRRDQRDQLVTEDSQGPPGNKAIVVTEDQQDPSGQQDHQVDPALLDCQAQPGQQDL